MIPLTLKNRFLLVEASPMRSADKSSTTATGHIEIKFSRAFTNSKGEPYFREPVLKQRIDCKRGETVCSPFTLFYIPQFTEEYKSSKLVVQQISFEGNPLDNLPVESLQLKVKTGNPEIVSVMSTTKQILFFLSVLQWFFFKRNLKKIPVRVRVIEQKLISRQGWLLILLNDPFYALMFYKPHPVHIFYTSIVSVAYYCHLMYLWLVIFERIYAENDQTTSATNQLWKRALIFVDLISLDFIYLWCT